MSKRNSYTDFIPVVGNRYVSPSFEGIILDVSERKTSSEGKEFIRFQVAVTAIFDETALFVVGDLIWRQATPLRKANGQWNVMRNAK